MSASHANCSFHISFNDGDQSVNSRSPFAARKLTRNSDIPKRDIDEKMEEVNRRKSGILEVLRRVLLVHVLKISILLARINFSFYMFYSSSSYFVFSKHEKNVKHTIGK